MEDLKKKPGHCATNEDIQAYVKEKYGFYVHSLYIAQVREMLGIKMHEHWGIPNSGKRNVSVCPEYKQEAIRDALSHFGYI